METQRGTKSGALEDKGRVEVGTISQRGWVHVCGQLLPHPAMFSVKEKGGIY